MNVAGTITEIRDHGTIVTVVLDAEGEITPVNFDHRCFRNLLAGEECDAADLIGRSASFDGEYFGLE